MKIKDDIIFYLFCVFIGIPFALSVIFSAWVGLSMAIETLTGFNIITTYIRPMFQ